MANIKNEKNIVGFIKNRYTDVNGIPGTHWNKFDQIPIRVENKNTGSTALDEELEKDEEEEYVVYGGTEPYSTTLITNNPRTQTPIDIDPGVDDGLYTITGVEYGASYIKFVDQNNYKKYALYIVETEFRYAEDILASGIVAGDKLGGVDGTSEDEPLRLASGEFLDISYYADVNEADGGEGITFQHSVGFGEELLIDIRNGENPFPGLVTKTSSNGVIRIEAVASGVGTITAANNRAPSKNDTLYIEVTVE